MTLDFAKDGAAHFPAVVRPEHVAFISEKLDSVLRDRPGVRISDKGWCDTFGVWGPIWETAAELIGGTAGALRPVRVLVFDKSPRANWVVPWHQDRTIAVRERIDIPGFGPWSTKDGIPHVEPPTALLQGMATLRLHLDDCGTDNAPLRVALGSHGMGLIPADQAAAVAKTLPQHDCLAQAGDIWAYSTLILHRSDRARMAGRRRVVQVDYATEDLPGGLDWYGFAAKK